MLFQGQNKKSRNARYFLKESVEEVDEGISDTIGFFAGKAKRAIFSKKETSVQFRNNSSLIIRQITGEQYPKIKDKMDKIKSDGDNNVKGIIHARDKNNQRIDIDSIDNITRGDVTSWMMTFMTSNVSISIHCYYGDPKTGTGQKYEIHYKQDAIQDKEGKKLPKEEARETATNEENARSLIEEFFNKMDRYLKIELKNRTSIKEPVPDLDKEKQEREERKDQSREQNRRDYEEKLRQVKSQPKVPDYDEEYEYRR